MNFTEIPILIRIDCGYAFRECEELAEACNVRVDQTKTGDIFAACDSDARNRDVYIIGRFCGSPWDSLMTFMVTAEAMKRRHARSVTLVVPLWTIEGLVSANYVGTVKTDTSRTIASLFAGGCVDRIVTLTPSKLLRSPLFPVEVIRPRYGEAIKSIITEGWDGIPLLTAESPEIFVSAKELGYELECDVTVNLYANHRANIAEDVSRRNVILYTEQLSNNKVSMLEDEVMRQGAAGFRILTPYVGINPSVFYDIADDSRGTLYTFDTSVSLSRNAVMLPLERVITEWLRTDIEERKCM